MVRGGLVPEKGECLGRGLPGIVALQIALLKPSILCEQFRFKYCEEVALMVKLLLAICFYIVAVRIIDKYKNGAAATILRSAGSGYLICRSWNPSESPVLPENAEVKRLAADPSPTSFGFAFA